MNLTDGKRKEFKEALDHHISLMISEQKELLVSEHMAWQEVERLKEEYSAERAAHNEHAAELLLVCKERVDLKGKTNYLETLVDDYEPRIALMHRQLQDALNTLKWYEKAPDNDLIYDLGKKAKQAIDRIQEQKA